MEQFIIFIVIISLGIFALAIMVHLERKRLQFWTELAEEWGFQYRAGDPYLLCERQEFALTKQGHSRRIKHLIEGQVNGQEMMVFDYTYTTGSGKSKRTYDLSVLLLGVSVTGYQLTIHAESFMDRIMGYLGFDDINFEYEKFNRAFQVRCDDKKFAYDIIHSDMMEYLMQHGTKALQWHNKHILFYPNDCKLFDKKDAEEMRQFALGFVQRLPSYMLDNALEK